VLSIRQEDLRSLAVIYDRSPVDLTEELIGWGVLDSEARVAVPGRGRIALTGPEGGATPALRLRPGAAPQLPTPQTARHPRPGLLRRRQS